MLEELYVYSTMPRAGVRVQFVYTNPDEPEFHRPGAQTVMR